MRADEGGDWVDADNAVARGLYETSGYEVTEELPTDLVMWKSVGPPR